MMCDCDESGEEGLMNSRGYLTAAMDNVLCSRLAEVVVDAGKPGREGVGDSIDRGLIARRLLEEKGFRLVYFKTEK